MPRQFQDRHFPVRPNLEQLRHQAKDLLNAIREREPAAVAEFRKQHPKAESLPEVKLADAQLALAHSYGLPSWARLVTACRMTDAIWRGDVEAVQGLVLKNPKLLHEAARGLPDSNWGPPMSYAANVGQDAIIQMLRGLGATDVQHAFDRACLQGKIETARRLYDMGARPAPGSIGGTCETLNDAGMAFLLKLGADLADEKGDRLAPVALLLQTYSRYPKGKHHCLELVAEQGVQLPDTPSWPYIGAASIFWSLICSAILKCQARPFPSRRSIHPNWAAVPTFPTDCTALPWRGRRSCTSASNSTKSKSPAG